MAKILNLDEMLELLDYIGDERRVEHYKWALCNVGNTMAADIADRLGIAHRETTSEGLAFAGTCASFWPKEEGQQIPEIFNELDLDTGGDWD